MTADDEVDHVALRELLDRTAQVTRVWHYIWDGQRGRAGRVYFTPGWGALVGASVGDDPTLADHVVAADRGQLDAIRDAVERGAAWDVEFRLLGLDGITRWARDRGVPDTQDGQVRLYGSLSDVSDDVDRRETIRQIAATIDEYYYTDLVHPDGRYETLFATDAVHRILGPIPDGLPIGDAWHRCVHPDDVALSAAATARLALGEDVTAEYRLVGFDGITRWVEIRCRVFEVRADGSMMLHGVAQDVTARRASEDRLHEIIATIDEVLYTDEYHPDGSIIEAFLSDGWHRLVGAPAGSVGVLWEDHIHPDDRWRGHEIDAAFRRCESVDATYRMVGIDGVTRWVRDQASGYRRADGVIVVNGILADVTVEREAIDALALARDDAFRLSRIDYLTGTYNRRHFLEELGRERERSARSDQTAGIVLVDIDHFKLLNDLRGHGVGDEILQQVAQRLGGAIRSYDTLARWGGEEFVLLVAGVPSLDDLWEAAERLRVAIESEPFDVGGERVPITVSVGVAASRPDDTPKAVISRADAALYAAKREGRNRTHFYRDGSDNDAAGEPVAVRLARVFAIAAGAREGMPENHLEDVAELSARVAGEVGLSSLDAVRCRIAGWLHDVGKVALPERILAKPGALDPEEWVVMRSHVTLGEELVLQVPELAHAAPAVRHHHERFDGGGYPDGLVGDAIPIGARIVAVVDAYSAMTSPRVYSAARTTDAAIAELKRCAGGHFDPSVVAAFLRVLDAAGITRESA